MQLLVITAGLKLLATSYNNNKLCNVSGRNGDLELLKYLRNDFMI